MKRLALTKDIQLEENSSKYLIFLIGSELYGIDIKDIREVIEYNQLNNITRIPMVPEYIRGVINLRGEVLPVIDLSSRFYNQKNDITKRTCIIIFEIKDVDEKMLIGGMIDAVSAVIDISQDEIDPTPEFGAKIRSDFISGIGQDNEEFIILLNIDKVLDINELSNFNFLNDVNNSLLVSKSEELS